MQSTDISTASEKVGSISLFSNFNERLTAWRPMLHGRKDALHPRFPCDHHRIPPTRVSCLNFVMDDLILSNH
jgi:hypothetical protein